MSATIACVVARTLPATLVFDIRGTDQRGHPAHIIGPAATSPLKAPFSFVVAGPPYCRNRLDSLRHPSSKPHDGSHYARLPIARILPARCPADKGDRSYTAPYSSRRASGPDFERSQLPAKNARGDNTTLIATRVTTSSYC